MARNIDSEAARLGALIEDLQILSSADAHTWKMHFGLGLAVAKELTRLHKGTLTVHDAVCGGACFVLTLN